MSWHKQWQYAMYKGDECLAVGTAEEICKQMNISIKTFHFYRTRSYKKVAKNSQKRRRIFKI